MKKTIRGNKFGTFKGVFVPSTEAILGTVLFLLLPALTADVGLFFMLFIVVLAHTVSVSTAFSISDCATNLNRIGGGGMYALSRRSLGKAFGGSIGIQLYFAQAASIAFYCIGFVEPLQPILQPLLQNVSFLRIESPDDLLRQKQILASIIFVIFFIIVMVGADFTLRIQMVILVVLFISVLAIFLSPLYHVKFNGNDIFGAGLTHFNLFGNRPVTLAIFFLVFTQFFPAVVGIDAGVGMSGELKDPKRSLVKGTFSAILITFVVYILATFIFSSMDKILLAGNVSDYSVSSGGMAVPKGTLLTKILGFPNIPEGTNGIKAYATIFLKSFPFSIPGIIVLLGILFATSSSALSCFMTAPRTAKSLSKDEVLPKFLSFLGNDFVKKGKEPRFAVLLSAVIGFGIIWIGNINVAAMIVGILFLVVYSWVNFSAFFERISNNPTFRPTFKGHWAVSLYGFLMSIVALCLFNVFIGVIIIISQLVLFQLILKYKSENRLEGVWWGVLFTLATRIFSSLKNIVQGTKNWKPIVSVIAFAGESNIPQNLACLGEKIAAHQGLVFMNIIKTPKDMKKYEEQEIYSIPTKCIELINNDVTQAILSIIQTSHPSNIETNSILMEYKKNLNSLSIVSKAVALGKNVFVLKNGEKLKEYSNIDIWWRGKKNGNIMVLLAYIINNLYEVKSRADSYKIRIIRKLGKEDNKEKAEKELLNLLIKSRLFGEVIILPYDQKPIDETINNYSHNADLIMVGMPGNINSNGISKIFKLNERFFDKELDKYDNMPAMLFVKSATLMNLIEDYDS